jgi:hypothetical protein
MHVHNMCSLKSEVSQLIRINFMMLIEINTEWNSVTALLIDTSSCAIKLYIGL